jgi:hypothetical protein
MLLCDLTTSTFAADMDRSQGKKYRQFADVVPRRPKYTSFTFDYDEGGGRNVLRGYSSVTL